MATSLQWLPLDTWIVVVAALSAASCALLGVFLVLRRMSMMGDAISHAVLPGLAAGFLLTNTRDPLVMLAGAAGAGLLTALLTQWIARRGQVDEHASMGVVFTVLFALGLILVRFAPDHVDLDAACVLYGALETVTLRSVVVGDWRVPSAALLGAAALVINAAFVLLLFKELRISAFDPALATTLGMHAGVLHYSLMTLVALTTVCAFESVGSILVVAMLVAPAAAAHLLTDRLDRMVLLSVLIGVVCAPLGHIGAIWLPPALGVSMSVSTSGMMSLAAGCCFAGAALLAPRHGILPRVIRRWMLRLRIAEEDLLGQLYRDREHPQAALSRPAPAATAPAWLMRCARWSLLRRGFLTAVGHELTPRGQAEAQRLIRAHRLWESYLDQRLPTPPRALHDAADRLEHITSPELQRRLTRATDDPATDPHGTPIPPA